MQIIHIVGDLDVASGGPSRSVPALAEHEALQNDVKVTVLYRDRGNPIVKLADSKVDYKAFVVNDLITGKFLQADSSSGSNLSDGWVIHLHGLWNPDLHRAVRFARKHRLPYVVSTKGMLAGWALQQKALKKKLAWHLYQKNDLLAAKYLLASSEMEQHDVASLVSLGNVVVVPNGCENRPTGKLPPAPILAGQGTRWACAIGRLHPVKGYAELIEAWVAVNPPGWKLAIAGPDEAGYRATLEELIRRYRVSDRVVLLGEVDDSQKWSLLDQCELFVAPSKTENFGMAIAEALQSGTPVITTTGTPWQELQGYNCGWWIGPDVDSLILALREATSMEIKALSEKGARGHRLIMEKYTWNQVAAKTIELYRSILEGKKHAPCH